MFSEIIIGVRVKCLRHFFPCFSLAKLSSVPHTLGKASPAQGGAVLAVVCGTERAEAGGSLG